MILSQKLITIWAFPTMFLFLRELDGKRNKFLSNCVYSPVSLYMDERNSCSPTVRPRSQVFYSGANVPTVH